MKSHSRSTLSRTLQGFFTDYLPRQRAVSPHTVHSYRDSLKLLLRFAAGQKGDPSTLSFEDFTVELVTAFLHHLEKQRRNRATSRNVRLSALHTFFRYVGMQFPEHLDRVQRLLSIPYKRTET